MGIYKGVKTLEVLEGADNYNRWIANTLKIHIQSPALEIGAGTGNISEEFMDLDSLVLSDSDENLVKILRRKFRKNKNIHVETLDISKSLVKPNNKFQTVFAINVLEHIEDDVAALKNMRKLLKSNGNLVVLVPAKKFAFSDLDKNLGHYRRYEKNELESKLSKAGFTVGKITFFNIVGLLSWLVRNWVTKNDNHLNKSHVKIFDSIVPFLQFIEPKSKLPVGISLIAVARK